MSKLKPSATKKKAAACQRSARTVLKAKKETDSNRRTKRPARDSPDGSNKKAGAPQLRSPDEPVVPVRRASGKRVRRRFNPNSWSVSIPTVRTNILCLGVSYPCVKSQLKAEKVQENVLNYVEESVEQAVELVRRNILTEMDGRDLARCLALEAANDTLAYCVSMESGAKYGPRHLCANFNRRSFVQETIRAWGAGVKFRQIILDYFWIPRGSWVMTHWARSFFNTTLPNFVTEGLLDFSSGESDKALNSALFAHSTAGFGGGAVYLPFCLHCIKEVIAAMGILSKYYTVSFLYKSDLKEHALWCATNSIEPEVMQSWFGKNINQEDIYCTFSSHEFNSSADDAHLSKNDVLQVLRGIEDFNDVRMIKLQALKKFDPCFKGRVSDGILGVDKGGFVGLKKAKDVERGFNKAQKKKVGAEQLLQRKIESCKKEENASVQKKEKIPPVQIVPKQMNFTKAPSASSVARKKASTGSKKLLPSTAKKRSEKRKEIRRGKKEERAVVGRSDNAPSSKVTGIAIAKNLQIHSEGRGDDETMRKFPLEIETLWQPNLDSNAMKDEEEKEDIPDDFSSKKRRTDHSFTPLPTLRRNESDILDNMLNTDESAGIDGTFDPVVHSVTPSPPLPEGADSKSNPDIAEHPLSNDTPDGQQHDSLTKKRARIHSHNAQICSLQSLKTFSPDTEAQESRQKASPTNLFLRPPDSILRGQRGGQATVDTSAEELTTEDMRDFSCCDSEPKMDSWRIKSRSLDKTGKRIKVNLLGGASSDFSTLQKKANVPSSAHKGQGHRGTTQKEIEERSASLKNEAEEPHQSQLQQCACGGLCEGAVIQTESEESALLFQGVVQKMHSSVAAPCADSSTDNYDDVSGASVTSCGGNAAAIDSKAAALNDDPTNPAAATATTKAVESTNKEENRNIALVVPDDRPLISDCLYLSLEQMEPCKLMADDRVGRNKTRPLGFPGLACRHCDGKAGCWRYFPASEAALSASSTSEAILKHVSNCRRCPIEIRETLELMKRAKKTTNGKKMDKPKRGGRKEFFHRLWCRIQGALPVHGVCLESKEVLSTNPESTQKGPGTLSMHRVSLGGSFSTNSAATNAKTNMEVSSKRKSPATKKGARNDEHFLSLVSELCSHRNKTGSLWVKANDNQKLYRFVNKVRKEYLKWKEGKPCKLKEEWLTELERIGFWEGTTPPKRDEGKKRKKATPNAADMDAGLLLLGATKKLNEPLRHEKGKSKRVSKKLPSVTKKSGLSHRQNQELEERNEGIVPPKLGKGKKRKKALSTAAVEDAALGGLGASKKMKLTSNMPLLHEKEMRGKKKHVPQKLPNDTKKSGLSKHQLSLASLPSKRLVRQSHPQNQEMTDESERHRQSDSVKKIHNSSAPAARNRKSASISFDAVGNASSNDLPRGNSQMLSPCRVAFDDQIHHRSHCTSNGAIEGWTTLPRRLDVGAGIGNYLSPPSNRHRPLITYHQGESSPVIMVPAVLASPLALCDTSQVLFRQGLPHVSLHDILTRTLDGRY